MGSNSRGVGPRAQLKNQHYREIAERQMEKEREKIRAEQNDSPKDCFESTTMRTQALARNSLIRQSCLNVSSENDLEKMSGRNNRNAVTYWSYEEKSITSELPNTPLNV
ncbi:hypothetical protein ACHAW6_013407 [Cyclotella cf. meneghiniana]